MSIYEINNRERNKVFSNLVIYLVHAILIATTIFISGCLRESSPGINETTIPSEQNKMSPPIMVDLSMSGIPYLGDEVELIFTVTALIDAPSTDLSITLPDGFLLVDGNLTWHGNITKEETIQISSVIKSTKIGNWTIEAFAISNIARINTDSLYVSVSETESRKYVYKGAHSSPSSGAWAK